MRLAVPDLDVAQALAHAWREGTAPVDGWEVVPLAEAERALRAGLVDLAFLPTLTVLRDPEAFSVVPGVALVGRAVPPVRLRLQGPLDRIRRVGIDPRQAQAALLAQVVLKEHYDAEPQFVPLRPDAPVPDDLDALLLAADAPEPADGALELDLGQEWFELTTRPMVWALLAARVGEVEPGEARRLAEAAAAHRPASTPGIEPPADVTLGAYAHAGLDALVHYLFYAGALPDLPEVPFVVLPADDADAEDDSAHDSDD